MNPRTTKVVPPRRSDADAIEETLRAVEAAAQEVLKEHAGKTAEAFARLDPAVQKTSRLLASIGALQVLDHDEPTPAKSRRKTPRPCRRCEAAKWLLIYSGELRLAITYANTPGIVLYALAVGRLQVHLGLTYADGVAYHEQQAAFAHHERGPAVDEKKRRNAQILAWNDELAFYPKGRRRERYERVRMIAERCQKTYRDLRAEAHSRHDRTLEAAAAVWDIGPKRIDQLIPRETKKTS